MELCHILERQKKVHLKETISLLRSKIKLLGKEILFKPIVVFRFRLLLVVRYFFFLL
ncbi:hypothetical protein ACMBCN_02160 [Candidatus Liberibacter asiaticus]|nr:hypothetical protein [Candidatus Liberibacter asiaticus]